MVYNRCLAWRRDCAFQDVAFTGPSLAEVKWGLGKLPRHLYLAILNGLSIMDDQTRV